MAKVVRKQALRVAGKTVEPTTTDEAETPKKVVKKVVKKTVAPAKEVELTEEQVAEQEAEAKAKKSKAEAKKKKAAEKLASENEAIANCGYAVGDIVRTKNGSEKEITKITSRAQGVHLWWETVSGVSAGGNYTSRVKGKVVDGVLIDPKTGETIAETVKPVKKKKVVAPSGTVVEAETVEEEIEVADEVEYEEEEEQGEVEYEEEAE